MKKDSIKELEIISNTNITAFKEDVKNFLNTHKDYTIDFRTTAHTHYAYIVYVTEIDVPEDVKDEYVLKGENYYCCNCPHWTYYTDERQVPSCGLRVKARANYRGEACLLFYQEMANGEIRPQEFPLWEEYEADRKHCLQMLKEAKKE